MPQWVAPCLLITGLSAAGASLLVPADKLGRAAWSPADAAAYSRAGQALHNQSFARPTAENRQLLKQANEDYLTARDAFDRARLLDGRMRLGLRYAGAGLVSLGLLVLAYSSQRNTS